MKLKFSIDSGLVFLLGGVVAGVAMATIITNLIRKRKQKKSIDNGTTAQPNRGMEDAQEPRSPLAPSDEDHNRLLNPCLCFLFLAKIIFFQLYRVHLTDQDGSEAGNRGFHFFFFYLITH